MSKGAADRKVGIVTFNGEVTVIGDGSQTPQHIVGDKLMDFDYLQKNGKETAGKRMQKTIKQTYKKLQS
jgi:hypothetical protein